MDEMDLAQEPFEPFQGVLRCPRRGCGVWEALEMLEEAPRCWKHGEVLVWRAS